MPTLRSRSVGNSSTTTTPAPTPRSSPALASTSPRSLDHKKSNKKTTTPSGRLVAANSTTTQNTDITALSLDPVTPAGNREHALSSSVSLRPQTRAGARALKQGLGKKLLFEEEHLHHNEVDAEEAVGRRSGKRIRREALGGVTKVKKEVVTGAPEMADVRAMADRGKRKVVDLVSDSDEEEIVCTDSHQEIGMNGSVGDAHVAKKGKGLAFNAKSDRARREARSKGIVKGEAWTDSELLEHSPRAQEGPESGRGLPQDYLLGDANESHRRAEATKAKFLEIARRRAAHFAHYAEQDEKPAGPSAVTNADSERSVDEQKKRAADLLARVSDDVGRTDNEPREGQWPGPFVIARQLVEGRAAAAVARNECTREAFLEPESSVEWLPTRKPDFSRKRVPTSLHDMCLEILCANIEHVQSLVGVPDVVKTNIAARLCAQRVMTPNALRLYFQSEPAEVIVPDCTIFTEETLTEALAKCSTERLEVLELGLCGRALSDQLITSTLAGVDCSLPILHTLVLNGAYRLTDNGLRALLRVAPNLTTLNLKQCNMISAAGLEAVAHSMGRTLKVFSLEQCSQLDALKVLPHLLKLSNLESVSVSGLAGMSDGIVSELVVILGSRLHELSIADCKALTDVAIGAISLCCPVLRLLDIGHVPLLTDKAIGSLANGCRSLRTLKLDRGKFSDTTLAALITVSGHCLTDLSLNSVRLAGDLTVSALAKYSKETLELLDMSFCRAVTDKALGLLADCCRGLHQIRLFGCTQVTNLFVGGHSNPGLDVIGLPNAVLDVSSLTLKPSSKVPVS